LSGKFFVKPEEVPAYRPPNHTGTLNRRLIGRETVGARNMEVVLGVIEKGHGALPHSHPGIEQVCYILQGRAVAEVCGDTREMGPGDCCYFPPSERHVLTVISEEPLKLLIVYSPPLHQEGSGDRSL
jgi:mannose-6-phosphate isomerase-like protein (cupin superfamily)